MPVPFRRVARLLFAITVAISLGACANARTVTLVRHAEAFLNLDDAQRAGLNGEQCDSLTEHGREHADRIGRELESEPPGGGIDLILASPLGRTMQTGARIAILTGADFHEAVGLRPRDEGESDEAVVARVRAVIDGAKADSVVLVTHGDVLGAFLGWLRRPAGAAEVFPPQLGHGERIVLEQRDGSFRLRQGPTGGEHSGGH